jgi:hypothetical protein
MIGVASAEIRAAVKKAVAWGTAVPCGAQDGILILPSVIRREALGETDDYAGSYYAEDGDLGAIRVGGDISMYLRYDGCDLPLVLAMGIAGVPAQLGMGPAYAYTYRPAADIDGQFATFVEHMKNYIMEIPSLKITGFTLKGATGKALTLALRIMGINRVHDSVINTMASFGNVTYVETANRVRYSQGVFRMNAASGAPLASDDRIFPSSFEFSFHRRLKGEYTGGYPFTSADHTQDLIDEPTNNGPPAISLKLGFPRHTSATYLTILGGDVRQKMDITFTGTPIGEGYNRTLALRFPHLQLINDDPADEEGVIKEPLEFRVLAPETPPPGMKGITDPFQINGVNERRTDPLT